MDSSTSSPAGVGATQGTASGTQWNQTTAGGGGRESSSTTAPSPGSSIEDAVLVSKSDFDDDDDSGVLVTSDEESDTESETESEYDSDDDEWDSDEEEEDDEDLEERLRILAEARGLKNLAIHFLHPELPVAVEPASFGRNYYNRPSAPEVDEDEEERLAALADAEALKKLAVDYAHPEEGVDASAVDPAAFGRNYYGRPSAPETEDEDDAEERAAVLEEAARLKKAAYEYLHPERAVDVDPTLFGRCYFDRPSAPEREDEEEDEERLAALADAAALKKLAVDFAHPERSVEVDPMAFGRNYFDRPSAQEHEDEEDEEEEAAVLADAAALKKLAVDFAHPEKPVEVDSTAYGRNYYGRPSAQEQEDEEDAEEQAAILAEAAALKKLAVDFAHPEKPVEVDPTCLGRNYFSRPSAQEQEDEEDEEEEATVLADAAALKKLAVDFAHPEKPVEVDSTAFGRNYYGRPSAQEQEDEEDAEEQASILAEVAALKKLAVDFAHPERPVEVDPTCLGRNYFSRPSAEEQEEEEDAEQQAAILAEAAALKKLAVDFAHPEKPVEVDSTAFGRNYYDRPSAQEQEDEEDAEQQAAILAEAAALKKLAVDFAHPERSVEVDPTAFGRNYFDRPSAQEQEDEEDEEEEAAVLADAAALKKLAVDFAHPERSVEVDPAAFGRLYFSRPSAQEQEEEDAEEQAAILAEAAALKKLAVDFAHPERPVEVDPTAFGRNYFSRPSAQEQEDEEDEEEEAVILADALALKKLAVDYAHPEKPVKVDPAAFGRNYFNRPSALQQMDEEADEQAAILSESAALKKLAVDFAHPEKTVEVDPAAFGRNYFSRPSAQEQETEEDMEEEAAVLAESAALKKAAVGFAHPEKPVEVDPTCFGRNYFNRPSATAQEGKGDMESNLIPEGASMDERKPSAKPSNRDTQDDHFDFDHLRQDLHAM